MGDLLNFELLFGEDLLYNNSEQLLTGGTVLDPVIAVTPPPPLPLPPYNSSVVDLSLPLTVIPEFTASFNYQTSILENGGGLECRYPTILEYQLVGDLSELVLTESEANQILNFFKARKGKFEGFRFRFWADDYATHEPEYYNSDETVYSQGIAKNVDGVGEFYLLFKQYTVGGNNAYKTIRKPILNSVTLYVDGVEFLGDFNLDTTTGIVNFVEPLSPVSEVTWDGEFELPVRFNRDSIPKLLEVGDYSDSGRLSAFNDSTKYFRFDSLPIEEVIEGRVFIETSSDYDKLSVPFDLSYLPQVEENSTFQTYELELVNKAVYRQDRQPDKTVFNLNGVKLNPNNAKYLLTYFNVARGKLVSFDYNTINNETLNCRFNMDNLQIIPIVRNDNQFTLGFDNLSISVCEDITTNVINPQIPIRNLTRLVKIARRDGVVLTFTSLDKDLWMDGRLYLSREAIAPTNIESKLDISVNNSEISSLLDSDLISDGDIIAGKYQDAEVTIYLVDFTNIPVSENIAYILQRGLVGEISVTDFGYTFEVLSLASGLLNRKASKQVSPTCLYNFGDSNCKFDLDPVTFTVGLSGAINNSTLEINVPVPDGSFNYGIITFNTGANEGLSFYILNHESGLIKLFSGCPYPVTGGESVTLVQGCAKTPNACKGYNNFINFGGFPTEGNFMPGNDFLLNSSQ